MRKWESTGSAVIWILDGLVTLETIVGLGTASAAAGLTHGPLVGAVKPTTAKI